MKIVRGTALGIMIAALIWAGCGQERAPRDPGGGGHVPPGSVGPGGNNQEEPDAGSDADEEEDVGPTICPLEPRLAVDPDRQPCCFSTLDCRESGALQAEEMVCYGAVCVEDGEGVCRVPPELGLCWTRSDCEDGEQCVGAVKGTCEEPMDLLMEVPGNCV